MTLTIVLLLLMPLGAGCAALLVGVLHRDAELEDAALVRHFLFMLGLLTAVAVAIGRTEPVRRTIDPAYRIARELDADPVIQAVAAYDPEAIAGLRGAVATRIAAGATLQAALEGSRPLLFTRITGRIGFADPKTRVTWASMVADALDELAANRPQACWQVDVSAAGEDDGQREDGDAAVPAAFDFSAGNDRDFLRAVVAVYESADRGMRHDPSADAEYAPRGASQAAAQQVFAQLESDYGSDVARALHDLDRRAPAEVEWSRLCEARRDQLAAMLEQPAPVAGTLVDSLLR